MIKKDLGIDRPSLKLNYTVFRISAINWKSRNAKIFSKFTQKLGKPYTKKINENQQKSTKINEYSRKSIKFTQKLRKLHTRNT